MKRTPNLLALLAVFTLVLPVSAHGAAKITIINQDVAGVGFNDTTPATPIGGNTGTTVGEQRLIAFEKAAEIWGQILDSNVEVRIQAKFAPLDCETNSGVLGSAGPLAIESGHPGAPVANTWYHIALANRQAGEDRDPARNDIQAQFNGDLGKPGCLTGLSWYYGLDGLAPDNTVDLLVVLLHEFAHGLGFSELINDSNGSFCCQDSSPVIIQPDAFSRFILDNVSSLTFVDMTNSQRRTALTSGNLAWTGEAVLQEAPNVLDLAPSLKISSPGAVAGTYFATGALFGGSLREGPFSGRLVLAEDANDSEGPSITDACTMILNQSAIAGRLAVVDRGTCPFSTKAMNVQQAGAIGMIVVQNNPAEDPFTMGGDEPLVTIPLIMISNADGVKLKAEFSNDVQGSIVGGPAMAGSDAAGRVFLYAPSPFEPGSSTSHWDRSATPNLLMEPSINQDLGVNVDLTTPHFRDIGWFAEAGVAVTMTSAGVGSQGPFVAGDTIRYEAEISQFSGSAATSVRLTTALDSNVSLVGGSVDASKGAVVLGNQAGDETVEILLGGLKPGEAATVRFDVTVNENIVAGVTQVTSSATVSGSNFDPIEESSSNEVDVNPMKATKTVSLQVDADESGTITRGDTVRYQINLENTGSTALTGVVVTDDLDAHLSTVQVLEPSSGTVTAGSTPGEATVVWEVPLVAGGTETIIFDAIIAEDTPSRVRFVLNQATVSGTGFEATVTDNPNTAAPVDATSFGIEQPRRRGMRR
jgi:uncharacterized repeat protein (TIGR01451 family)